MLKTLKPELLANLDEFIDAALKEDAPHGDITSLACIPSQARCRAKLLVKEPGVLAGVHVAERIFKKLDPESTVEILLKDGTDISYGDVAFRIECNTQALLRGERVALNLMQRMSGIATQANHFAFEVGGLPVKILDTRKTTPLLRFLEKYAVKTGGCHNYRNSLSDWFMIKDNHIDAAGGVGNAIQRVNEYMIDNNLDLGITVEVRNLVELHQALDAGSFTRIMLDNFEIPLLAEAVATVNKRFETEASGGINIHNVRRVAQTGVEYISVGALTHSAQSLDLSLKIT
ncbi:MAG TPA: carboxylating nicotinate-nucleotide diphosphorylase [Bacteroidetes bacterium]|nr:carboxylating nicotinate-nucleotide diphosphorylase [Bacteroidota bacterium]